MLEWLKSNEPTTASWSDKYQIALKALVVSQGWWKLVEAA
jgi:hypothetical protein